MQNEAGRRVPAIIYAAKSTADPRGSIETQRTDCEAMAAQEGWTVASTYSDEAASAYRGNRGDGLAQAREHAARLAAEHGEAVLVVQHTDRLARGDGVVAQHLVEVALWALKANVRVRAVQDDSTGESLLMAVLMGERNHEDSKRKAAATAAGRRRSAERGEWSGPVPDGYDIERTPHGAKIIRRIVIHPERREVYRLIWDMAIDGATVNAIVRELRARGYLTAPARARPRPFDATRVDKVLVNPFYAGLMTYRGKIIGTGSWPVYVEPDDWYRLVRERKARTRHRPEPVGRPRGGLLARLVRCSCGEAAVQQRYGSRKDGSRRRVYTCRAHLHGAGACSELPFDAETVERMVLGGLDRLLGESTAWSDALLAGRAAERGRLQNEVDAARAELVESKRAIEKLADQYDAAVVDENKDGIELAQRALAKRRESDRRANVRLEASESALAGLGEELEGEGAELAIARLWRSLSGDLKAASGDVKAMNQCLRETFDAFELHRRDGELHIVPILSGEAVVRALRDPASPHRVTATLIRDVEPGVVTMLRVSSADTRMVDAVLSEDGSIASRGGGVYAKGGPADKVLRETLAELVEQGQSDVCVSVTGEAPTLVGHAMPVPPAPQYAPGFFARYCWW